MCCCSAANVLQVDIDTQVGDLLKNVMQAAVESGKYISRTHG